MKENTHLNFQNIRIFISDTLKKFIKKIPRLSLLCIILIIIVISIEYFFLKNNNTTNFWRLVPETCAIIYFFSLFYFFIAYLLYSFAVKFFGFDRIYFPNKRLFKEIFRSIFIFNSKELKTWNKNNNKFNRNNPKYKSIKITNIIMLFMFFCLEAFIYTALDKNASGWPLLIYFFWSRESVRRMFKINPDFKNKIVFTLGVWLFVSCIFFLIRF